MADAQAIIVAKTENIAIAEKANHTCNLLVRRALNIDGL
jgi:hypothetical protein